MSKCGCQTQECSSPPVYSILVISSATLAYEVLLMRLFSIIQWHHMAYMVISLALLGYGVSGTFVTLFRSWLVRRFQFAYFTNALLFGVSSIGCFLLAQRIPFNTLEILWDYTQWGYLFLTYLLLSIPFFFAANCICLAFACFGVQIPRIYGFDLVGAGVGAMSIILVLFILPPAVVLQLLALVGLGAAALAIWECRVVHSLRLVALLLVVSSLVVLLPGRWLELNISEYKGLRQAMLVPGTEVVDERSTPLGLLTTVRNSEIPLRHAPGLSLGSAHRLPDQLGVFSDGDSLSAIISYDGDRTQLGYLDSLTSALPYHVNSPDQMLLLGLGGGSGVLQAEYHAVPRIEVVEQNPQWMDLLSNRFAQYSGWSQIEDRVQLHLAEGRSFVQATARLYDQIHLSLSASLGSGTGGVYGLSESYLYTKEAIQLYLQRLREDGFLAITGPLTNPPRASLKLFATAVAALRRAGVKQPGDRLLMIRGWNSVTLLIANSPFSATDISRAVAFCQERSFDLAWYPGMEPGEANRYNLLPQPYLYQGAGELLGDRDDRFFQRYKFDVTPASDDRPYFFHFFRWSSSREIASQFEQGGMALMELGYPVLIITLLQAVLASVILVLLPLRFLQRGRAETDRYYSGRVVVYFLVIGLAFLFVEIAFIQKFILFLGHPLYAIAVVLSGFLVFSGLGSSYVNRSMLQGGNIALFAVVAILGAVSLLYLWLLPGLFDQLAGFPDVVKIAASILLIAPLAFCMGMPFPIGLAKVSVKAGEMVPWAWGINGCASLISAILATLLAIHFGFSMVIISAVMLYLVAAATRL